MIFKCGEPIQILLKLYAGKHTHTHTHTHTSIGQMCWATVFSLSNIVPKRNSFPTLKSYMLKYNFSGRGSCSCSYQFYNINPNPLGTSRALPHQLYPSLPLFFLFIYLCCAQAFSSCGEWGLLFVAVHGLLIAVASLVAQHRL